MQPVDGRPFDRLPRPVRPRDLHAFDPVARAVNGHRRYAETDRARVDFLKLLKATGMPISQMVRYVELYRQGESTFAERGALLEAHRQAMQAQMATLARTMELVEAKIARYFQSEDALVAG